MTVDKAFKRAVRERMRQTGEKYTEARRALGGTDGGAGRPESADPIAAGLRPGRLVAFVCGGGFVNFSLVMPYLIQFQDRGHHLTYVLSERDGILEIPSPFDFACARGITSTEHVAEILADEDAGEDAMNALIAGVPNASLTDEPMHDLLWARHLREKTATGRAAVLWVNDVQVGPPLARAGEGGFDGIADQLVGLRRLAVETGAIIALGHCMPAHYRDGWDVIVNGVDETFVISSHVDDAPEDHAEQPGDDGGRMRIEHHWKGGPAYSFPCEVDTGFGRWRSAYMRRRSREQERR